MRSIFLSDYDPQVVYKTCIDSISNVNLRDRLNLVTHDIVAASRDYKQKAEDKRLYTMLPNLCKNNEIALGTVTKQELKDVYSSHMVGKLKPARKFYDLLLSQAPLGQCPYCGFGHASTLDHYLPKAKYPQLSVLSLNLVPSCKDCNTRKNTKIATVAEKQSLHPYFDHKDFINEQWLFAEVMQTNPVTISFVVKAPTQWDEVSKGRVLSHFDNFELSARYSIEASSEIVGIKNVLDDLRRKASPDVLQNHLHKQAKSHADQYINSWKTAMYQALACSDWYCGKDASPKNSNLDIPSLETCPRCLGRCKLADTTCEVCKGLGSIRKEELESLKEPIDEDISCPSCIAGELNCEQCKGEGKIRWEKAKEFT